MNIYTEDKCVVIDGISDFDVTHTFDCGQCFRWEREEDGSYTGVAFGKVVNIASKDNRVVISNSCVEDVENIWIDYLDLKEDYGSVKSGFSADENLSKAMDFGFGIRILRQDLWETIVSFIISANNNIPRIKKIINKMCELFGEKIEFDGKIFYGFPTPEALAELALSDLAPIRAGFRDKYILDAAKKVVSGEVNLDEIPKLSNNNAKSELMKIKGVGTKVTDCVLLFSLGRHNVFPLDVWTKRIINDVYGIEEKVVPTFIEEHFGKNAGIAQQYLYYYYAIEGNSIQSDVG